MGCCKEIPRNNMAAYEDLPDSTFLCMARMAYQLSCTAEHFYTGRGRVTWGALSEEKCVELAAQVKQALRGRPVGVSDGHFDALFARMLRTVTSTV